MFSSFIYIFKNDILIYVLDHTGPGVVAEADVLGVLALWIRRRGLTHVIRKEKGMICHIMTFSCLPISGEFNISGIY